MVVESQNGPGLKKSELVLNLFYLALEINSRPEDLEKLFIPYGSVFENYEGTYFETGDLTIGLCGLLLMNELLDLDLRGSRFLFAGILKEIVINCFRLLSISLRENAWKLA